MGVGGGRDDENVLSLLAGPHGKEDGVRFDSC